MSGEVRSAVLEMRADRVGHGYAAASDGATLSMLKERGVHVEACPKSALKHGLLPAIGSFRENNLSFGLSTDDPASWIGNTSAGQDEDLVREYLAFGKADISRAYRDALSAAFGPVAGLLADAESETCSVCKYVASGLASGGSWLSCTGICLTMAWDPPVAGMCGALCAAIEAGACHAKGRDDCALTLCQSVKLCTLQEHLII